MYQTINSGDFVDAFKAIRPDNFTYKGFSRYLMSWRHTRMELGRDWNWTL